MELLEKKKSVTAEELAEVENSHTIVILTKCTFNEFNAQLQIIFGSMEPLESYSSHVLLSKDEVYFSVVEAKGSRSVYGPRPSEQVLNILVLFFSVLVLEWCLRCS